MQIGIRLTLAYSMETQCDVTAILEIEAAYSYHTWHTAHYSCVHDY